MKTKIITIFILLFSWSGYSQMNDSIVKKLNKSVSDNIEKMLTSAFYPKYDLSSCKPSEFYKGINKSKIYINDILTGVHWKAFKETLRLPPLKDNYDKGLYNTLHDKAIDLSIKNKKASSFIKSFTGKELGDVNVDDQKKLRMHFNILKKLTFNEVLGNNKFIDGDCSLTARSYIKLRELKLGPVVWEYSTKIFVNCNCGEAATNTSLKEADYTVEATSTGKLSYNTLELGKVEKAVLDIKNSKCCGNTNDEDASIQVNPNENISLPEQTIGFSGGIGFEQDFEETSICLGAEYLYNATHIGNSPFFVGANAQFSTTSFMDFSNTWVSIGPTAQLFCPITPSEEVHMTNGINANYIFGTNDNNGFKDDISGFGISINTGLNIQLKENFSISLVVPVISYQNLTYDAQDGEGSVDVNNISVLLNKENPVKVGLRIGF